MLGFLTACAQMGPHEAENATARKATESARTYAEHDRLAQRYQSAAKELRAKAEEQKKQLQHYEEKSYLYGRQAQDNKSHTAALLSRYERAVEDNENWPRITAIWRGTGKGQLCDIRSGRMTAGKSKRRSARTPVIVCKPF